MEKILQEEARRSLELFARRYPDGERLLDLAAHAALPVVLNADLLHLLRINFFMDEASELSYLAESTLLLSPLCHEIGNDLYEIEAPIRDLLLQRLARIPAPQRIQQVASLLWQYSEQRMPWGENIGLERAQQLTALSFLDFKQACNWLDHNEENFAAGATVEREWFVALRQDIERNQSNIVLLSPLDQLTSARPPIQLPLTVFIIFAMADQELEEQLYSRLSFLQDHKIFDDRRTYRAALTGQGKPVENLDKADVVLLLLSPDFMNTNFMYNENLNEVLKKHRNGAACVIPILLKPCAWQKSLPSDLNILPNNAKAITQWQSTDSALLDVVQGIRNAAEKLIQQPINSSQIPKIADDEDQDIVRIYIAYAREDQALVDEFLRYLNLMLPQGKLSILSYRGIMGQYEKQVGNNILEMDNADIILLLISADFFASDYGYEGMLRAVELQASRATRVFFILLRPSFWELDPFGSLQALPSNKEPVTQWSSHNEAFMTIQNEINQIIQESRFDEKAL